MNIKHTVIAAALSSGCVMGVSAQNIISSEANAPSLAPVFHAFDGNTDETMVPAYTLPDVLTMENGKKITDKSQWPERRAEILDLLKTHMYGELPEFNGELTYKVVSEKLSANEKYIKKQVVVTLDELVDINVLLFLPNNEQPRHVFLGLNFSGNQAATSDKDIVITESWANPAVTDSIATRGNRFTEQARGVRDRRFPIDLIIENGYGLATVYYGDINPDYDDGFNSGIHQLFSKASEEQKANFSAISAWAWGLSRVRDYFEQDTSNLVDEVIVYGHSRLGKAALWAGAQDPRFAMVISNNSGQGGAAIGRRDFGETIEMINYNFPHWFNQKFKDYNDNSDLLPVDQHMVMSLIAPRPVYVASASQDLWADPKGEFLSLVESAPTYELLAGKSIPSQTYPAVETPITGIQSYHIRDGAHDLLKYDWQQFIKAADANLN